MTTFENNEKKLEALLDSGLSLLKENYTVKKLDAGKYSDVTTMNTQFLIAHYEIEGVGHLMTMKTEGNPKMQMITYTLMPYFKALPLLSMDYMFAEEGGMIINEVYELSENRESDEYRKLINEYKVILDQLEDFPNIPAAPCFYDSIRPVYAQKARVIAKDDISSKVFADMVALFVKHEKETRELSAEEQAVQKAIQHKYVDDLIDENGFTTKMWVAEHGVDFVRDYYHTVFFGV